MNKFMKVYESIINEQMKQQTPAETTKTEEKDLKATENNYANISKNYPLFAVYSHDFGAEKNGHHIDFIPNEAAFKKAIEQIVNAASDYGWPLYTDKKNMLYYGSLGELYEEIYFIEGGKDATGLVGADISEVIKHLRLEQIGVLY